MACLCLCAGILRPAAWSQDTSEPEVLSYPAPPAYATVQMRLLPSGDVGFSAYLNGMRRRLDVPQLLRGTLGCDWQPDNAYRPETAGVCHHLLKTGDGPARGALLLNPLVMALHASGAEHVSLSLILPRRPRLFTIQTTGTWRVSDFSDLVYEYESRSMDTAPVLVQVQPMPPPNLAWFAAPLLAILLIPPCAALILRRRRHNQTGSKAIVWVSWIQLSSALLWLVAWPPGRIVEMLARLHLLSLLAELVVGGLVCCGPPLLATGISFLILRDRLVPEPEARSIGRFLRRYFLPQAGLTLIFTFLLIGLALDSQNVHAVTGGLLLGLCSGIGLIWFSKGRHGGSARALQSGMLHDRVMQLAGSAGVRIRSVSILWNWSAGEANAGALLPSRRILVTDSLLKICTRRETDAVLAHEVGHFRQGPGIFPPILGWAFTLVYLPCHIFISGDALWVESLLALLACGLMLAGVRITRRREFRADQWSVYCTQDPLALISGLGRVARLRGLPLDWSRFEGCILTHPSLRRRALRLARHCNLPEGLALAALEDPDSVSLVRGVPDEHYSLEAECPPEGIEFSGAKKTSHLARTALALPALILLLTFALAAGAGLLPDDRGLLVFLLGLPFVLWASTKTLGRLHRRFFRRIAMAVSRRLPAEPRGDMVTLIPGPDLEATDGFYAWDIGRLAMRENRLVYLGEKASFSVPRAAIAAVEVSDTRRGLGAVYGVRIRTQDGAFVFREALRATSRRRALAIAEKWGAWLKTTTAEEAANGSSPGEFPPPALPATPARATPQARSLRSLLLFPVLQFAVGEFLSSLLPESGWFHWAAIAAPLLYCVILAPVLWFRGSRGGPAARRTDNPPQVADAPHNKQLPYYHQQMPLAARMQAEEAMAVDASRLAQRANAAEGEESVRLLADAQQACENLLASNPRHLLGLQVLAHVLAAQAMSRDREEAVCLCARAQEIIETAAAIAPDNSAVTTMLGHLLLRRALLTPGEAGMEFLSRSRQALESALRARPSFDHARILWAHVLAEQARRAPGEGTDRELAMALATFDAAASSTNHRAEVMRGKAAILFAQAMRASGEERLGLLREAREGFLASESREPGSGAYRAACVSARLGEEDECRKWLEQSREPGILVTRDELAEEPHLESVRDQDWFQALIGEPVAQGEPAG